jgi:hypothetical protein
LNRFQRSGIDLDTPALGFEGLQQQFGDLVVVDLVRHGIIPVFKALYLRA